MIELKRYRFKTEHQRADAYHGAHCDVKDLRKDGKKATHKYGEDEVGSYYAVLAEPDERLVAKKLIEAGLARGYAVSVQDGEEWVVKRSTDAKEALDALFSTGEDRVMFRDAGGDRVGTFLLIGGNAPDELIADHTDNGVCNEIYDEVAAQCGFERG